MGFPTPFPARGKGLDSGIAFGYNGFTPIGRVYRIPDFGRFSLRTAHAVLRSNLPHSVAHATGHGFTDGRG
jgi:hypothetical protein